MHLLDLIAVANQDGKVGLYTTNEHRNKRKINAFYGNFRYFNIPPFVRWGKLPPGNFVASPAQRVSNFRTIQIEVYIRHRIRGTHVVGVFNVSCLGGAKDYHGFTSSREKLFMTMFSGFVFNEPSQTITVFFPSLIVISCGR